jgi:hypothetical protein
MPYPWPVTDADVVLDHALDIALDYLEFTGQAFPFSETQRICAIAILNSWRAGATHRIKLANDAIPTRRCELPGERTKIRIGLANGRKLPLSGG